MEYCRFAHIILLIIDFISFLFIMPAESIISNDSLPSPLQPSITNNIRAKNLERDVTYLSLPSFSQLHHSSNQLPVATLISSPNLSYSPSPSHPAYPVYLSSPPSPYLLFCLPSATLLQSLYPSLYLEPSPFQMLADVDDLETICVSPDARQVMY